MKSLLYIYNMNTTWEDFYAIHPPPQDFDQSEKLLKAFVQRQLKKNNMVVLITVSVHKIYIKSLLFKIIHKNI